MKPMQFNQNGPAIGARFLLLQSLVVLYVCSFLQGALELDSQIWFFELLSSSDGFGLVLLVHYF